LNHATSNITDSVQVSAMSHLFNPVTIRCRAATRRLFADVNLLRAGCCRVNIEENSIQGGHQPGKLEFDSGQGKVGKVEKVQENVFCL